MTRAKFLVHRRFFSANRCLELGRYWILLVFERVRKHYALEYCFLLAVSFNLKLILLSLILWESNGTLSLLINSGEL